MKRKHKLNHGWSPSRDTVLTDRYVGEVEQTSRKAERAWRAAERAAVRAERLAQRRADADLRQAALDARRVANERYEELRQLDALMRRVPLTGAVAWKRGPDRVRNPLPRGF